MLILIYPPIAKPCEPPAGIARLSGMLSTHGIKHLVVDANIEGILHLLQRPVPPGKADNAWTLRAFRNSKKNLLSIRDIGLYRHIDRYKRAVSDTARVLSEVSPPENAVGLANYEHKELSPLRSGDLLTAAERPELNPFYPYFRERLKGIFKKTAPSAVGISVNYLSQALSAFSIIGFIRHEFPGLKVILGGGLITTWTKNPRWGNPFSGLVDHLVAGPGEKQLISLLGVDATGEKMPRPDYQALPLDSYLSPGFILPYSASSGCYWSKCTFCPENAEANSYMPVSTQQVISDLKALTETTNPVLIHLLDNAISPMLLNDLSIDNTGIPWYGFARIGNHLADLDFCIALKRSGCVLLKLGIESADQGVLDAMNKGINIEAASIVIKNLKKAGIATYVYLIFGTPLETEESARKTLRFTVQHSNSIDFLNLAIFNMPVCGNTAPGIETRKFYDGDLSIYTDFTHPYGWDRKRVRLFLENEFKQHPAVSAILKNEPPIFTSNHAPFFVMGH